VTISAIQIGLHPSVVDFGSPEFARFPGSTPEKLQAAHDGNIAQLRAAGFDVDGCQVDLGETAVETVRAAVTAQRYDARFVFNTDAVTSPEDIRRWFGSPEPVPLRVGRAEPESA
jgi:hypothetical protein